MRTNDDDRPRQGRPRGGAGRRAGERRRPSGPAPMIGGAGAAGQPSSLMVVLDHHDRQTFRPLAGRSRPSVGVQRGGPSPWGGQTATPSPSGALLLLGGRSGDLLGRAQRVHGLPWAAFAAGLEWSPGCHHQTGAADRRPASPRAPAPRFRPGHRLVADRLPTFPARGEPRNRAVGVFAAMEGLGAAAGLLLGRDPGPGGVVAVGVLSSTCPSPPFVAALAPRLIPSPKRQSLRLDLPGAVTASGRGSALIVFGPVPGRRPRLDRHLDRRAPRRRRLPPWPRFVPCWSGRQRPAAYPRLWVVRRPQTGAGAYMIQALVGGALFGMFFPHQPCFLPARPGLQPPSRPAPRFVPATVVMMGAAGAMFTAGEPDRGAAPSSPRAPRSPRRAMWWAQPPAPPRRLPDRGSCCR